MNNAQQILIIFMHFPVTIFF